MGTSYIRARVKIEQIQFHSEQFQAAKIQFHSEQFQVPKLCFSFCESKGSFLCLGLYFGDVIPIYIGPFPTFLHSSFPLSFLLPLLLLLFLLPSLHPSSLLSPSLSLIPPLLSLLSLLLLSSLVLLLWFCFNIHFTPFSVYLFKPHRRLFQHGEIML